MESAKRRWKPVSRERSALVMLAQGILFAAIAAAGILSSTLPINPEEWIYPLCCVLTATLLWSVISWRLLGGGFLDAYLLFLVAVFMFNGAQCGLELFHLNQQGILGGRFSSETIAKTVYLVSLGLASLHCGALVGLVRQSGANASPVVPTGRELASRLTGQILLGLSIIPACFVLSDNLSVVMAHGYMGLFGRTTATGFGNVSGILSSFLLPAMLYTLAGSRGRRKVVMALAVLLLIYVGIYLFIGLRGGALMALAAFLWLYHQCIRRIPRSAIVTLAVLVMLLIPIIGIVRTTAGEWRLSVDAIREQVESSDRSLVVAGLSEMGRSMSTVAYTLDLVPDVRGLDYGVSYCYALLSTVPNLGWEVHPTNAHGLLADWLVRTVDPGMAAHGGGLGFSLIAEAYLNFGWTGAPMALALIGWALRRFFHWAESSPDPARKAVLASFLSFFLLYARGESAICIRALVWYAFVPYLMVRALTRKGSRHRSTAVVPPPGSPSAPTMESTGPVRRPEAVPRRFDAPQVGPAWSTGLEGNR